MASRAHVRTEGPGFETRKGGRLFQHWRVVHWAARRGHACERMPQPKAMRVRAQNLLFFGGS